MTYLLGRANGETLREWKLVQEGWLFVAGIVLKPRDKPWVEPLGLAALATWEWIPGTVDSVVPQLSDDATTEVTEVTESVTLRADAAKVWALIRHVEHNALLHDNYVDAFRVPDTPDGIGEEQAVILQYPGYRRTVTSIIVDEDPLVRLVTRTFGVNDRFDQQTYSLEPLNDQTRLTVTMRYSVGSEVNLRTGRAESSRAGIHTFLTKVTEVLNRGWTPTATRE